MRRLPLLFAALIVGACAFSEDPSGDPRTIVVWELEDASVTPFIDAIFKDFAQQPGNDGVRVIRTHFHPEDLRQQFLTASIAGSPPDLVIDASDRAGIYSIAGFILPVNGLFAMERYNKPVVDAISLDGKTWGVPISNGNHLMLFYNKKLAPRAPETTDELFRTCKQIVPRHKLAHCAAWFAGEPFWLVPWLGAFGGFPIDNKTPTLDTEAMRRTLAFLAGLIHDQRIMPAECDYNCMDALFKEGKAAFIINGDWAISSYREKFGADLGVARIPKLSQTGRWPAPMISGRYFMLSSKLEGAKLDLVRRLVEFYTNEKNQTAQVAQLMRLPALKAAMGTEAIRQDAALQASKDQLMVGTPMPMATEIRAVWDAIRPHLAKALLKKITPAEAARKMQKDAAQKIAEMND
ncbi:MAG: extracellular solute-binding protein [Elusimicrobiota bacterium]